jgi:uncharacterized protein YqjF (DUF2071 family)
MHAVTGPPPPRRPWHAFAWLDHFAIVSYLVDPARLDALLPDGLTADRVDVDGSRVGVVSAVSCVDRDFHFRALPWVTMSAGQIDYRAYVTDGDRRGVWFFGASLDSPLVVVARRLWSMPWHRDRVTIDAAWLGRDLGHLRLSAGPAWGRAELELTGSVAPDADPLASRAAVTDPLLGWYAPRPDRLHRYQVWHPPLDLRPARVARARHEVFIGLGLVDDDQSPISALVQPTVALDVQTPPRRDGRADAQPH